LDAPGGKYNNSSPSGIFTGTANLTAPLTNGPFALIIGTDHHLARRIPGFMNIQQNQTNTLQPVYLVAGDANSDNVLNIKDYNQLIECYGGSDTAVSCDAEKSLNADFNDDGLVNQFDYNLFLREISQQSGD
jgi:hypothetical protein